MNEKLLMYMAKRPEPYQASTAPFWDDEHISKGMLAAHLNSDFEGATRRHDFVQQSAQWIAQVTNVGVRNSLLDLGCGPGIYAELFTQKGFAVTGVDLSKRSIDYARNNAQVKGLNITYECLDYLDLDYVEQFDVVTMIYCDFGVLPEEKRKKLLAKAYKALKPNGIFICDVFTANYYANKVENKNWHYCDGGYWSTQPYGCFEAFYRYDDINTYLEQYIVVTQKTIECYNMWNYAFTREKMTEKLKQTGFKQIDFFADVAGQPYNDSSQTICIVAVK